MDNLKAFQLPHERRHDGRVTVGKERLKRARREDHGLMTEGSESINLSGCHMANTTLIRRENWRNHSNSHIYSGFLALLMATARTSSVISAESFCSLTINL